MPTITKYNAQWDSEIDPVDIERECIRKGGRWKWPNGSESGEGLFHHFKALESLLWPEDYHNRWTDWMLEILLTERICVFMGSKDSGKTRRVSKWALMDYWCFPQETLIVMTSTTAQGLELRVWGDIKSLWQRARELHPNLEGNPVDAKHGLFTDDLSDQAEIRDMRKGIIGVPTMTSEGEYQGMALKNFAGIKQKRRRLIGDECFPAGTMVDTLSGPRKIDSIVPGELVLSAVGFRRVVASSMRVASKLVRITTTDGRQLTCTPNHPILTTGGWKKACEISESMYIIGAYETLCLVRERIHSSGTGQPLPGVCCRSHSKMRVLRKSVCCSKQESIEAFLQSELLREMENVPAGLSQETLYRRGREENRNRQGQVASRSSRDFQESYFGDARFNSRTRAQQKGKSEQFTQIHWTRTKDSRRQWNRSNQGGVAVDENVSRRSLELWNQNGEMEWEWLSSCLQSGSWISRIEDCHRSRWSFSQFDGENRKGSKEGLIFRGSWVDSVEILQPGDSGFPKSDSDCGGCRVFNLQVEGHPSYSVNGLIVHNCQFVSVDYLKVLYAMDSGNFKGAFLGNAIADNGKALDRIAEPVSGWSALGEVTKTQAWKNKFNGVTLNLVGVDSPNLDPATRNQFEGMITQEAIDRAAALPGARDSVEWWSQIMGVRKSGVVSDRVLTVEMIQNNGGFGDVIWSSEPTLKILAIDAGYGGDDCVSTYIECGTEVGGIEVILFREQKVIPVLVSSPVSPEDQIANAAKSDCDALQIPYENVFIEAGMRATLAVSFGRILSPAINAINFGGSATQRPVSNDLLVFDERTQQRRLKMASEHYSKFVTELAFSVRAVVESGQARMFPMAAAEEFQKRKWRFIYGDRYELESKVEYKERNASRSPNYSDSAMVAVEGARRLGFVIERLKDPNAAEPERDDWLEKEIDDQARFQRKHELTYE